MWWPVGRILIIPTYKSSRMDLYLSVSITHPIVFTAVWLPSSLQPKIPKVPKPNLAKTYISTTLQLRPHCTVPPDRDKPYILITVVS